MSYQSYWTFHLLSSKVVTKSTYFPSQKQKISPTQQVSAQISDDDQKRAKNLRISFQNEIMTVPSFKLKKLKKKTFQKHALISHSTHSIFETKNFSSLIKKILISSQTSGTNVWLLQSPSVSMYVCTPLPLRRLRNKKTTRRVVLFNFLQCADRFCSYDGVTKAINFCLIHLEMEKKRGAFSIKNNFSRRVAVTKDWK